MISKTEAEESRISCTTFIAEPKTWTITVCPHCEEYTLPAGAFRARCPGCHTYFSRDDERPEDRDRYPEHWEKRVRWLYPTPGTKIKVRRA